MSQDLREAVKELRSVLLEMHRVLLEIQRTEHEREHGRVERPAELLGLVMNAETFAWLRPMSGLIVRIDEALAQDDFGLAHALAARAEAEDLFASESLPFRERYLAALQDPDVVVAHARWRQAISALPR